MYLRGAHRERFRQRQRARAGIQKRLRNVLKELPFVPITYFQRQMAKQYHFELLVPHKQAHTRGFGAFRQSHAVHAAYTKSLKRLRGYAYLEDGAIAASDLDGSGCLDMVGDDSSWHLLLVDDGDDVIGCVRLLVECDAPAWVLPQIPCCSAR